MEDAEDAKKSEEHVVEEGRPIEVGKWNFPDGKQK